MQQELSALDDEVALVGSDSVSVAQVHNLVVAQPLRTFNEVCHAVPRIAAPAHGSYGFAQR
jgi:hypothetical protein